MRYVLEYIRGFKLRRISTWTPLGWSVVEIVLDFEREGYSKTGNMVLAQPENKHVMQVFSLKGKVAIVTGKSGGSFLYAGILMSLV